MIEIVTIKRVLLRDRILAVVHFANGTVAVTVNGQPFGVFPNRHEGFKRVREFFEENN